MKKIAIAFAATLLLASCADTVIPLPGDSEAVTTVGYYAPTSPDQGGQLGAFTQFRKKAPVVLVEK